MRQKDCKLFGIKWPDQNRCLGIYVGYSRDKTFKRNWDEKLQKVKHILASWKNRDLSLFAKVQIIKTFVVSQFVLPASLLVVPPEIIKKIETMLYEFLWGSRDKVKRVKVTQDLKLGGLNMINIKCLFMSFKAVWITRLLNSDPEIHNWAQIAHFHYKPFLECNTNLLFNFDENVDFPDMNHLSPFYRDVLLCFNKSFVGSEQEFTDDIGRQCIWGNKHVSVRKRSKKCVLFLRNWIRSGVNKIGDLRFVDGKLDIHYMDRKITSHFNIYSEVLMCREALLPYQESLRNMINSDSNDMQLCKFVKSKPFYLRFKNQLTCVSNNVSLPNFLSAYCNRDEMVDICHYKKNCIAERN